VRVALSEIGRLISLRRQELAEIGKIGGLAGAAVVAWCRMQWNKANRRRERRLHEELEAYAQLDARLPQDGDVRKLSRRVSQMVSESSSFKRVGVLVRDAEGCLYVAGSAGMEDATVNALNAWAECVVKAERSGGAGARRGDGGLGIRVGNRCFAVILRRRPEEIGRGRAIIIPLRTSVGRMVGALVVCADGMMSVPRRAVDRALLPLEALAVKLGRRMENAALAERLLRAEKLAGLGLLADGMVNALSNPLTAVLGFAELIADTTNEARVKTDAKMIVREALRMRQTVDVLLEFWRPSNRNDEPVDVTELLREVAEACREKLVNRGVRLIVQAGDEMPVVRGSRDRLRQMLEHLLNNAAQAVASAADLGGDEEHAIRLTVSQDNQMVHLIVSDTGPGFREPGRVFDPFYTARRPSNGAGLGLSLCYGIVREHDGEISAFNLHPHGAAVVVELPVGEIAEEKNEAVVREWSYVVSD
jgi:signal transduction histidine kinase